MGGYKRQLHMRSAAGRRPFSGASMASGGFIGCIGVLGRPLHLKHCLMVMA